MNSEKLGRLFDNAVDKANEQRLEQSREHTKMIELTEEAREARKETLELANAAALELSSRQIPLDGKVYIEKREEKLFSKSRTKRTPVHGWVVRHSESSYMDGTVIVGGCLLSESGDIYTYGDTGIGQRGGSYEGKKLEVTPKKWESSSHSGYDKDEPLIDLDRELALQKNIVSMLVEHNIVSLDHQIIENE